jgi:hypothetical protein
MNLIFSTLERYDYVLNETVSVVMTLRLAIAP